MSILSWLKSLRRPRRGWRVKNEAGGITGPMTYERALDWTRQFGGTLINPKEKS